jgi:hypothetical protein
MLIATPLCGRRCPMTKSDWMLLAITAAGAKGLSPVQLQKTLFLLGKEMPEAVGSDWYAFEPYNYGPFDRRVYEDAESLARKGEVEITQRAGENWNRFTPTRDGEVTASWRVREAPPGAVDYLNRLVEWVQQQTFQKLVSTIYAKYPEMRANSVFQG